MSKAHAFNAFKIAAKLTAIGMVAAEFYFRCCLLQCNVDYLHFWLQLYLKGVTMLNYLKNFVEDCKAGYRAATTDFQAGYTVGDRTTDTLVSQQMAALALSKPAKKTKAGTPEDDARKAALAEVQSFNPLIAASQKASLSFKVGRWMRNPLINTWKFVKQMGNVVNEWFWSLKLIELILLPFIVAGVVAFAVAAINTLGLSLLVTTSVAAGLSIAVSRILFVANDISGWAEWMVDTMIFIIYTMAIMS